MADMQPERKKSTNQTGNASGVTATITSVRTDNVGSGRGINIGHGNNTISNAPVIAANSVPPPATLCLPRIREIRFGGALAPGFDASEILSDESGGIVVGSTMKPVIQKRIIACGEDASGGGRSNYHVIVLGDAGVGKTSLIKAMLEATKFECDYRTTIGYDMFSARVSYEDGTDATLRIDDTAGSERYNSLVRSYIRNVDVVLFVFDVRLPKTLESIWKTWVTMISDEYIGKKRPACILVANKWDGAYDGHQKHEKHPSRIDEERWHKTVVEARSRKSELSIDTFWDASAAFLYHTREILCCAAALAKRKKDGPTKQISGFVVVPSAETNKPKKMCGCY